MGRGAAGLEVMPAARARQEMKKVFDRAIHQHLPVPMERGAAERMFGLGNDDLKFLLNRYEFHPDVMFDAADDVSIWLPEFSIYGTGATFDEAKEDLLEEVLAYVAEYFSEDPALRSAPNRRSHYPYALRVAAAAFDDELEVVLFSQPAEPAAGAR